MSAPRKKKPRANITQLHRATKLDRATVRDRLEKAGVKPKAKKKGGKEVIFDADEALKVLARGDRSGITDARLKRLNVAAARELLKLKKERGQLVDRADALNEETRILKWLIKELSFRRRRAIVTAVRKARTQKEAEPTFTRAIMEIFEDLRAHYRDRGLPDE